jgi:predicted ATP-grasp superfamily ATP-dependent carboligase
VVGDSDLLRPLALEGIRCAVFTDPMDPVRYSRFARFTFERRPAWLDPEGAVDQLVAFGSGQPAKPVLYFQDDASLLLVSRNRERLRGHFRIVVAEAELVEQLVDKRRFAELARRHQLPVPRSREVIGDEPLPPESELGFPLIAKPLIRREQWDEIADGAKAIRIDDVGALRRLRKDTATAGIDLLLQELLPGPESRVESYHCYVDEDGLTAGEFTGRKIRTWPPAFGHSTSLELTNDEELAAAGREIVSRIGLRGVAKLDFKRTAEGRLYLLEVNARFSLWHHLGARAGVNLPFLVYCDVVGEARPPQRQARAGARWCWLGADLQAARAQGVPPWRWLAWALRSDAKTVVAFDDPLPFLFKLGRKASATVAQSFAGSRRSLLRAFSRAC